MVSALEKSESSLALFILTCLSFLMEGFPLVRVDSYLRSLNFDAEFCIDCRDLMMLEARPLLSAMIRPKFFSPRYKLFFIAGALTFLINLDLNLAALMQLRRS